MAKFVVYTLCCDSLFIVASIIYVFCVWSLLCNAVRSILSYFLPYSRRGKESWLLYFYRFLAQCGGLFVTAPWVGLRSVIVVFPGHTHLPFDLTLSRRGDYQSIGSFSPRV